MSLLRTQRHFWLCYTLLHAKGELLITIMSSLAQEESRSISENVTWGQRKRIADGKVSFAYSLFLGLDNGAYRNVMRGVQKCTCAGASLKSKKTTPLCCINLGTATDCCCGSGGMFVQSAKFIQANSGKREAIAVYGQEANADTWKMAKINMAIRGIDADFGPYQADTFTNDLHPALKADFILANPPFNYHPWNQEKTGFGQSKNANANQKTFKET